MIRSRLSGGVRARGGRPPRLLDSHKKMNEEKQNKEVDLDKVAQALSLNSNKVLGKDHCPNPSCGFQGEFRKERRGNLLLLIINRVQNNY